jgi:hypothetical protein
VDLEFLYPWFKVIHLTARGTRLGMVLGVLAVVIIGLMVLKPTI